MRTDALGHVIEVDEPDPATGSLTAGSSAGTYYTYDLLGNRTNIYQGSQTRTFPYDGLSRLTAETSPARGIEERALRSGERGFRRDYLDLRLQQPSGVLWLHQSPRYPRGPDRPAEGLDFPEDRK